MTPISWCNNVDGVEILNTSAFYAIGWREVNCFFYYLTLDVSHKVIKKEVRLLKTRTNELEAQNSTRNT